MTDVERVVELQEMVDHFYSACCYLDRAIPVFGFPDNGARIRAATDQILRLRREVEVLRQYGNKDCTAMADEALEEERAGGVESNGRSPVKCDKCYRVSPNRGTTDQAGQRCGEQLTADDPGCDGVMQINGNPGTNCATGDAAKGHGTRPPEAPEVPPVVARPTDGVGGPWKVIAEHSNDTEWRCAECAVTVYCPRTPVAWGHSPSCRHHPGRADVAPKMGVPPNLSALAAEVCDLAHKQGPTSDAYWRAIAALEAALNEQPKVLDPKGGV
jgi:hypothetical protein